MTTFDTTPPCPAPGSLAAAHHRLDFIGDIHGNLPALLRLGRKLGYDVDRREADPYGSWTHPDGRLPVFLGDLIDRGPYSLETATLVAGLVGDRRAFCILGNHEYNLVAWEAQLPGWEKPKRSNEPTCEDVGKRKKRWAPVLKFFRTLPIAIQFDDLRVVHASWHLPSLASLPAQPPGAPSASPFDHVSAAVFIGSPFDGRGMRDGWLASGRGEPDTAHEVLLKGHELPAAETFSDADGHPRTETRVCWWLRDDGLVPRDRAIVVGHYWNMPPVQLADGRKPAWAPPAPSGHPDLRAWWARMAPHIPAEGTVPWDSDHICVDFNGFGRELKDRACVGAVRWPEREVVWATAPLKFTP